jgi:SNF2 family DNA or RNA helicase
MHIKSTSLRDGRIALYSPYDKRFVDAAHNYPGLSWDKRRRAWVGYRDSVELLIEELVGEGIATYDPSVETLSVNDVPFVEDPKPYPEKLHEYQKEAVQFVLDHAHEGVILADGLGLGKTLTTLTALQYLELPAVVISPRVVKNVWLKEGAAIGTDVFILSGTKAPDGAKISESDGVLVVNYDVVYAWLPMLVGAKTVVLDEAHNLFNSKSRRSKACKELCHAATNRIALTATPVSSKPIEIWNIVDTISPGRFGYYTPYGLRYAAGFQEEIVVKNETRKVWNFKRKSHTEELSRRLKTFMIRRTKDDVALELPAMTRQIIELDLGTNISTGVIPLDIDEEWMRFALSLSARGKIKQAVELALDHVASGSSVVVAAYRHEVAEELRDLFLEQGVEPYMATGAELPDKRLLAMDKAAENQPSILIVTTHAVGEGINKLTYADVSIIVELDYVPRWIIQYEGRLHRQGQKRNVLFQYLIGLGTIDEIIRDRVLAKIKVFEDVIGSTGDNLGNDLAGSASEEALLEELCVALRSMET